MNSTNRTRVIFLQVRKTPICRNDSGLQTSIFSHDLRLCGEYSFSISWLRLRRAVSLW
jgi:hypothetical protein